MSLVFGSPEANEVLRKDKELEGTILNYKDRYDDIVLNIDECKKEIIELRKRKNKFAEKRNGVNNEIKTLKKKRKDINNDLYDIEAEIKAWEVELDLLHNKLKYLALLFCVYGEIE